MKLKTTLLLFIISINLIAQKRIYGLVINSESKSPIEFVNIGIVNTTVGTASFEDGTFEIEIPNEYLGKRLTFSAIGYKVKTIDVSSNENIDIKLEPESTVLSEVRILSTTKSKSATWGSKPLDVNTGVTVSSIHGGGAFATYVPIQQSTMFINKIKVYIEDNELEEFRLRCRIKEVDEDNRPGDDLLSYNVIATSAVESGWVTIDLSEYNFYTSTDFYLVFEWIMDKKATERFKKNMANPLAWRKPNSAIVNGKLMVYKNEQGKKVKQKLTAAQIKELKTRDFRKTTIGVKKQHKKSMSYSRFGSMASWKQRHMDLVSVIEYEYMTE